MGFNFYGEKVTSEMFAQQSVWTFSAMFFSEIFSNVRNVHTLLHLLSYGLYSLF